MMDLLVSRKIDDLEKSMLSHEQVPCPVVHRFGPGTYMREVTIPAHTLAIGHHQNFHHTNILLKGKVTVLNDDGSSTTLSAPMIFIGKPGRKVGYIHEDMVWLNVYSTDEQNIDKLERYFLSKSLGFRENLEEKTKLLKSHVDVSDFDKMILEFGLDPKIVREQSENEADQTALPLGSYKIKVGPSLIEGCGLFATADICENEIIAPARISGLRTIAGRFTNHSVMANSKMVSRGQDIDLVAVRPIKGCHGGFDGEEITIDYRQSLELNLKLGGKVCLE